MAIHGLTRVTYQGDKAIIVAGPTPPDVAVRGLTEVLVEDAPVDTPMTPLARAKKQPNKPPKFVVAKPQADPAPAGEKESK